MFDKFWQSYCPWHLAFLHILACLLNSSYLHPCMDLNESWQGCCTSSLEVRVRRKLMFHKCWQSYRPWHLKFLHILACLLTPPTSLHGFEWNLAGVLHHKSRWTCGRYFKFYKFCRSHDSWNVCLIFLLPLWNKPIAGAHVLQTCFV